ncbi:MAG: V-type ATP synthase subunit I [Eubacterium sp.]|nr:V-type ATP synthase subunit I [Eubacterium sp.]
MAIVDMRRLNIYSTKKHRKGTLEFLQDIGAMEIDALESDDIPFEKMDTSGERIRFQKIADEFDHVIELLEKYDTSKKGSLLNLENDLVSRKEYRDMEKDRRLYYSKANDVLALEKEIAESKATITRKQNKIATLSPWSKLDIPLNSEKTKCTKIFIGTFPDTLTEEAVTAIATEGLEEPIPVTVEVLYNENQITNVCVIATNRVADQVEENMRSHGYSKLPFLSHRIPNDAIEKRKNDIVIEEKKIEEADKAIAEFVSYIPKFKIAADYFRTRSEKYRVLGTLPQSDKVFFIQGWVEKDKAEGIAKILEEKYDAVVEIETDDEAAPIKLKNNHFSEASEGVLESYGLPTHGRVDPTTVMSFFYVFLFGMMLSDAGYGIIMSIACGIVLLKYKRMASGTNKMLRLFFWCGISTTFWGFMFGGFFGDAIDVIAHTFFGVPQSQAVLKPLWFAPLNSPMRLLIWCLLFGIIHLYAGLAMKGYEYLKQKDIVGFFSDVIAWYMFLTGLILMLLPTKIFASIAQMEFNFPGWLNMLAKIITIVGLVVIILMSGRANKNWGLRIALGAYDIYGVTGWLSDVLSYSRLLALGLATGVIASVINMMASMQGKTVFGVIIFILVFILGHTLNIAINLLGAYVHTNRLQYVEFFGKFYDAGGTPFSPFKSKNKYIEIKED